MKKNVIVFGVWLLFFPGFSLFAQDLDTQLKNARSAYASGDLEGARFAIQEAIKAVDLAVGEEVLKLLPEKMGDLTVDMSRDQLGVGNLGFVGIHLSRYYGDGKEAFAEVSIIAESPLLAGVNAILSMPFIGGDSNQKRIRLGRHRGLLQRSDERDGQSKWEIQIPFGSSLLALVFRGISDENAVMDLAGNIPMDELERLIQ